MSWISLHTHSQYSILDSTLSVKAIAQKAKEYEMSHVAITDSGNMFGVIDFYKACRSSGVKPILGCEIALAPTSRFEKKRMPGAPLSMPIVLLIKNKIGYQNLCKLSSAGFIEGFYYRPRIDKEILQKHSEGLICLSGPVNGPISFQALQGFDEKLLEEVKWFKQIFKEDFYFELQRHKMSEENTQKDQMHKESWTLQKLQEYVDKQERVIEKLTILSKEMDIECVATNDIHYMQRDDWKAHEILLNIQSGEACEIWERDLSGVPKQRIPNPKRKTYSSHESYFKSSEEMCEIFSDHPKSIENTKVIAEKCQFEFDFRKKHYPVFIPKGLEDKPLTQAERQKEAAKYLYELCTSAIKERYSEKILEKVKQKYPDKDPLLVVQERLDHEFKIISSKGMCDYLLIVYDFISWAKKRNIPVGPGRGSAAGSIISYLIGITDIEPLHFHLFFERFINPERISYPDIDVDICMGRREEVIDYTIEKYGKDKVAQIITFGTMKAKMAIKDVGRVLSVALSKVNAIAKLVPDDLNITIEKALKMDPELKLTYERDDEAKMILDMAQKIEGSIRNTSTHAAGMIISASPIDEYVPVCVAKDANMIVTQYAMKPVEAVGMLKIDFLGLKTLTSIQKAVDYVATHLKKEISWTQLPLDDQNTYDLLNRGKTLGIFQLESAGMQELAKQLHIDHFEEIIAVGALYRPGPMDMIPSFIQRKHKKEPIEFEHPLMREILEETYGIMVYQEQVMQIASALAGYSLGEGDVLRRAMGKKDRSEMARQREQFLQRAIEKGIEENIAISVFDKIEKFASYGFNKSHATAYAYLSYVTAYLKANYPTEWMAALLTCDRDDISKVAKYIQECRSLNIPILPPDVNEADVEFIPTKNGIRFAMSGIKGVGEGVVDAIVEERNAKGNFENLYDFIRRIDTSRVGKKIIEVLIDAGSFDFTKWSRDEMKAAVEPMYEVASREQKETAKGVINLFSLLEEDQNKQFTKPPTVAHETSSLLRLQKEKEILGFYLNRHPMDDYQDKLKHLSCVPFHQLQNMAHDSICRLGFIIEGVKVRLTNKHQRKFAILTISDGLEQLELPIWPEMYEEKTLLLRDNQLLYAIIQIDRKEDYLRLNCRWLEDLTKMNEEKMKEADLLYDQIKAINFARKNNNSSKKFSKKKQQEDNSLTLMLDANILRLSHILALKKIIIENSGSTKVEIQFLLKSQIIGKMLVDSRFGVNCDMELKKKLSQLPYIQNIIIK